MAETLLDIVQEVLNELDSDAVNSITDTLEATQIASLVQAVFKEMAVEFDFPHMAKLFKLEASGSASYPTHMKIPADVTKTLWIKYRVDDKYRDVDYLLPDEFVDRIMSRDITVDEVDEITDYSGVPLYIRNDKAPTYWTSFDNEYIVFDSYDSTVESTLQESKVMSHGYYAPSLAIADGTVPDMPVNLLPLLKREVLSRAAYNYKNQPNEKAEQASRRLRVRSQRNKWRQNGGKDWPDYGR